MPTRPTAFVLGAPGGIGTGICTSLAEDGWTVIAAGRNEAGLVALCEQIGGHCEPAVCDAYDAASIVRAIDAVVMRHGRLDGLVNLVADTSLGAKDGQLLDVDLDIWDRSFASSIRAYFVAIRAALPHMLNRQSGAIVNISSIGALMGDDWLTAYASAKAGIEQLTRNVAVQYGQQGIRCNTVIPGVIAHQRVREAIPDALTSAQSMSCVPRNGMPSDIGDLVAFLLGPKSGFITGEAIVCDGGLSVRAPSWRHVTTPQ